MKKTYLLAILAVLSGRGDSVRCQLSINECMASNVLAVPDEHGDYDDWVEIYNPGTVKINMGGYYLSDNVSNLKKWKIPAGLPAETSVPAHGYLVLWADNQPEQGSLHAGFRLSSSGGSILLTAGNGITLIDSMTYPEQRQDVSYGRFPDGSSLNGFIPVPTPGSANRENFPGFAPAPDIFPASGFSAGSISVTIQPASPGDSVHYTTDGSDPDGTSLFYSNPVPIARTTAFRARTIRHGLTPGDVVSKIYFIGKNHDPVLSIITDPDNLFNKDTGIYANPVQNGRQWEREISMDYFRGSALQFSCPAGLRIQGNTGRLKAKKSFRCYFRKGYGLEVLDYPLFDRTAVDQYRALVLRSGYDDALTESSGTLLRDPLINELWRRSGNPASRSQFAVLYLNGAYWGIYDIREDIDNDFIRNYYHSSDIDMIRLRWPEAQWPAGWGLEYGDPDEWQEFIAFMDSHSFASDSMFAEAANRLDIENFTTLMAFAQATQYRSWNYGAYVFKEKCENARWQWIIWDMDRSYSDLNWNEFTPPSGYTFWVNGIAPKLFQNPSYRRYYINRLSDLLNTTFLPDSVISVLDSLASRIEPEIPAEAEKWGSSTAAWYTSVEALRNFIRLRPEVVRQQMQAYFHLSRQAELTLETSGGTGKIKVNSVTITRFPWSGKYYKNIPVTLTAIPEPGYRFVRWSDPSLPAAQTLILDLTGDRTVSAVFSEQSNANIEIITPGRIKSGQRLPVVVRIRDVEGKINPSEETPVDIQFEGLRPDTLIEIKRGAGTCVIPIQTGSDFTLSAGNAQIPLVQKQIVISTVPVISHSGTLSSGDVVWDDTADRLISSDLFVPAGCHLIIRQGVWVKVKKHVNIYVRGKISVQGTADQPVVITPDVWTEPWGGMEFTEALASFRYCMVLNGGGDISKGKPTQEDWHTGHQHIFFGKDHSEFEFDHCFFLNSPGKVFGAQDSKVTVTSSLSSFVWHGGEFHRVLLTYRNSHLMNLPDDDPVYSGDIDTDGFHIDYVHPDYPQYSIIDNYYFVTGKDDAIDHHHARLRISNCWIEGFIHEGVAASGGDTVQIFNTVALGNDQGFEAGWTENGVSKGPYVFIDHCVSVDNHVGLRIGDSYDWNYRDVMKVTNSVIYNNRDNIMNYLNSTHAPLEGAIDIAYSMTNDPDYDSYPDCITGIPQFDDRFYLLPGSVGSGLGTGGTNLGLVDSTAVGISPVVINEIMYREPDDWMTGDWVELYNPQSLPQDLSGWILKDDGNEEFCIPAGTLIPGSGYLIICEDSSSFRTFYPQVKDFTGNLSFGLGRGDQVRLFSAIGERADMVSYDNSFPWPVTADGTGHSLSLTGVRQYRVTKSVIKPLLFIWLSGLLKNESCYYGFSLS